MDWLKETRDVYKVCILIFGLISIPFVYNLIREYRSMLNKRLQPRDFGEIKLASFGLVICLGIITYSAINLRYVMGSTTKAMTITVTKIEKAFDVIIAPSPHGGEAGGVAYSYQKVWCKEFPKCAFGVDDKRHLRVGQTLPAEVVFGPDGVVSHIGLRTEN